MKKVVIHRGCFDECDPPTQLTRAWGQVQWLWDRHRARVCHNGHFFVDRAVLVDAGEEKTQSYVVTFKLLLCNITRRLTEVRFWLTHNSCIGFYSYAVSLCSRPQLRTRRETRYTWVL